LRFFSVPHIAAKYRELRAEIAVFEIRTSALFPLRSQEIQNMSQLSPPPNGEEPFRIQKAPSSSNGLISAIKS
jgi:hypothetical protein